MVTSTPTKQLQHFILNTTNKDLLNFSFEIFVFLSPSFLRGFALLTSAILTVKKEPKDSYTQ
ncbi:CLUMA_CG000326, isoform A [Clunio marinus]|uniref:CLUMA_CG000326, isoform A n=1 Tax=Clunio marinus TaxID=568069 RepID=A0A1J1HEY7_9DIPT|nr:CLUMA_CG000326, isoform A [Clunio marinus]